MTRGGFVALLLLVSFASARIFANKQQSVGDLSSADLYSVDVASDELLDKLSREDAVYLLKRHMHAEHQGDEKVVKRQSNPYDALEEIYEEFDGANWYRQGNWTNRSVCFCDWEGVECDSGCDKSSCQIDQCLVVGLRLADNNLSGQLASAQNAIEGLTALLALKLDGNRLTGTILRITLSFLQDLSLSRNILIGNIPDLATFPNLQSLDLSFNRLSRSIPAFDLPDLQLIDLSNNELDGAFPELKRFPKLTHVSAASNRLSANYPDFYEAPTIDFYDFSNNQLYSYLFDVSNIRAPGYINIGFNRLSGLLPQLKNITNTYYFNIEGNQISGVINENCFMPNLVEFNLNLNSITGSIPKILGFPSIKNLYLSNNTLFGNLPDAASFATIERVDLSGNRFTGFFPQTLSAILIYLSLSSNLLTGSISKVEFPSLEVLDISGNKFEGNARIFSQLSNLKVLSISNNQFTGDLPTFSNLARLRIFKANQNHFYGQLPEFPNPSLEELHLNSNLLNGTLPALDYLRMLSYADFSGNHIEGEIPQYKLNSLRTLIVSRNRLTGSIPDCSGTPQLANLDVSFNQLTGSVPYFEFCPGITRVDGSNNMLTGTVPAFSALQNLSMLYFSNNQLSGSLPEILQTPLTVIDLSNNSLTGNLQAIRNLEVARVLNFADNKFDGTIPGSVSSLLFLQRLALDRNQLTGTIPSAIFTVRTLEYLTVSNNAITGDLTKVFFNVDAQPPTSLKVLDLSSNLISGTFTNYVQQFLASVDEITFANNNITSIEDTPVEVFWKSLDLSRNPISGTIPDSLRNARSLYVLSLRDTLLRAANPDEPKLPSFLQPSTTVLQYPAGKLYYCPQIVGTDRNLVAFVDPVYYSFTFCQCVPGSVGRGDNCLACDSDCQCPGGVVVSGCYPSPSPSDPTSIDECLLKEACNPDSKEEFECAEGHEDRLCSKCASGYHALGRDCRECLPGVDVLGPICVAICLGIFLYALWFVPAPTSGLFRLTMMHIQFLSILNINTLDLPIPVTQFVEVFSPVANLVFPARDCTYGSSSPYLNLLISGLRSFVFLAASLTASLFASPNNWRKIVSVAFGFFHLMYFDVARRAFGVLGCTAKDSASSNYYLTNYPWIECDPVSDDYADMYAVGIPLLILHVIGYPVVVGYVLFANRKESMQQDFKEKYGHLFACYHPEYYYWEMIILARKLLLGVSMGLVPYYDSAAFCFLIVLILQSSVWLQIRYKPYVSKRDNRMELWSLNTQVLTIILAFLISFVEKQDWISAFIIMINIVTMLTLFFVLMQRSTDSEREVRDTTPTTSSIPSVTGITSTNYRSYKQNFADTQSLIYRLPDS